MSQPPDLHYPTFQLMSETFVRSLVLGELLRDGTNPELRILKNLWISGRLRSWHDREMAKAWRILGPVECCSSLPALTTYTNEAGKLELVIRISRWTSAGLCPAQIAETSDTTSDLSDATTLVPQAERSLRRSIFLRDSPDPRQREPSPPPRRRDSDDDEDRARVLMGEHAFADEQLVRDYMRGEDF